MDTTQNSAGSKTKPASQPKETGAQYNLNRHSRSQESPKEAKEVEAKEEQETETRTPAEAGAERTAARKQTEPRRRWLRGRPTTNNHHGDLTPQQTIPTPPDYRLLLGIPLRRAANQHQSTITQTSMSRRHRPHYHSHRTQTVPLTKTATTNGATAPWNNTSETPSDKPGESSWTINTSQSNGPSQYR